MKGKRKYVPSIILLLFLVGLPMFSETLYTPALPSIAQDLNVDNKMVEHTFSIYLLGFTLGTLLWGRTSDKYGRRPCVLIGLIIYIIGTLGCFAANSIYILLLSRLIQSIGASVGNVLTQAITRDVFRGSMLRAVYTSMAAALMIFPAIGPILGGTIVQYFSWRLNFLLLTLYGSILFAFILLGLPETHRPYKRIPVKILNVLATMVINRKVIFAAIIIGTCNGIIFSYYAEGPFFLISKLGLLPSHYGAIFCLFAGISFIGGIISRKLQQKFHHDLLLKWSLWFLLTVVTFFALSISIGVFFSLHNIWLISLTILSIACIFLTLNAITPITLANALTEFRNVSGVASSLLGFSYNGIITFLVFIMANLHSESLLTMPYYFLFLSTLPLLSFYFIYSKKQ